MRTSHRKSVYETSRRVTHGTHTANPTRWMQPTSSSADICQAADLLVVPCHSARLCGEDDVRECVGPVLDECDIARRLQAEVGATAHRTVKAA